MAKRREVPTEGRKLLNGSPVCSGGWGYCLAGLLIRKTVARKAGAALRWCSPIKPILVRAD
jgi:hypothetical protein